MEDDTLPCVLRLSQGLVVRSCGSHGALRLCVQRLLRNYSLRFHLPCGLVSVFPSFDLGLVHLIPRLRHMS
jgi:hypothetical protein